MISCCVTEGRQLSSEGEGSSWTAGGPGALCTATGSLSHSKSRMSPHIPDHLARCCVVAKGVGSCPLPWTPPCLLGCLRALGALEGIPWVGALEPPGVTFTLSTPGAGLEASCLLGLLEGYSTPGAWCDAGAPVLEYSPASCNSPDIDFGVDPRPAGTELPCRQCHGPLRQLETLRCECVTAMMPASNAERQTVFERLVLQAGSEQWRCIPPSVIPGRCKAGFI